MPGYKGGARPSLLIRHGGFTKMLAYRRTTSACDYATLGSKPREPPNQNMPTARIVVIIIIIIIIIIIKKH
jgi:hypothetical protein